MEEKLSLDIQLPDITRQQNVSRLGCIGEQLAKPTTSLVETPGGKEIFLQSENFLLNRCVISEPLLRWYDSNARCLPWRDDPTPYRVWISEIMLQQTRVGTVKPYFERFIKELPTAGALAAAGEQQLLKLWEGLGYYHRAGNLKKAAMVVVEKYSGELPSSYEQLIKLPGIGPYTAGAIASIAFGARTPAIDGNVLRVVARITANRGDLAQKDVKRDIEHFVHDILPAGRTGDFNQALMELGATVCLPNGVPRCEACPVNMLCAAYRQDMADELPVKPKKRARRIENRTVFVILCNGKTAIRKRPDEGLLAGLWELPNMEGHICPEECGETMKAWGITAVSIQPLPKVKHIFSHVEWHMTGYLVNASQDGCQTGIVKENVNPAWEISPDSVLVWATPQELTQHYTLPTAFKPYMKVVSSSSVAGLRR